MNNPFFWLGISVLLVAISLVALLSVAIFTLQELARAARSAEKLLDTLNKELPATLRDLRLTGQEISGLTDDVASGVQSARSVVTQVDKGLTEVKVQAQKAHVTTRSLFAGATAALQVLSGKPRRRQRPPTRRPSPQPLVAQPPAGQTPAVQSRATQPPSTQPPSTQPSSAQPSITSDGSQKPGPAHTHTDASAAKLSTTKKERMPVVPTPQDAEI